MTKPVQEKGMNRIIPALAAAIVLASVFQAVSAAQVRSVKNHGADGDATYYSVLCSNGAESSIKVQSNPNRVCASPIKGQVQCQPRWELDSAARFVCR
jgi:hypothetical protein